MNERTPVLDFVCHAILVLGAAIVCLPIYFVFVTGSQSQQEIMQVPLSWLPGDQFLANMQTVLSSAKFGKLLLNSFVVACGITLGKLAVSLIAAFAVTYFRFPFRLTAFWLIFMSLMLPIEVRIVPTYESAANVALPLNILGGWLGWQMLVDLDWNLVNTYSGLILPLIASATATFLFRQFFLTLPDELCEAARIDGATPLAVLPADPAAALALEHRGAGDHPLPDGLEPVSLAAPAHHRARHGQCRDRPEEADAAERLAADLASPDERGLPDDAAADHRHPASSSAGS